MYKNIQCDNEEDRLTLYWEPWKTDRAAYLHTYLNQHLYRVELNEMGEMDSEINSYYFTQNNPT